MTERTAGPKGVTCHYELHDDGLYVVWEADFLGDKPGRRKVPGLEAVIVLSARERLYIDMRSNRA